ncbi:hypothetical protein B0H15DRAFT_761915, partial [Mycena belliarum]
LAGSTRYASVFHREQAIMTYLQHTDVFDTYQSLSLLLANKYKRALDLLGTAPALGRAMRELGVQDRSTFVEWLAAEKACLMALKSEPLEETLAMEYYQKLVNLDEQTYVPLVYRVLPSPSNLHLQETTIPPLPADASAANYAEEAKATRRLEAQRRHASELYEKVLLAVHDLESRMGIAERWLPDSEEWKEASIMVGRRRYQRALDGLQGLIIARMFELTKMNMSGTGYKMRKHIAKALQARSAAVKTALETYNAAAARLRPPRPPMTWEQVVDYAFLSDFDLLQEGREDIREQPWAKPAGRLAMDVHFKLLRAEEEIERLNLEIPRFVTYMRDEAAFLRREVARIREEHGDELAHQVECYRMRQGRFNDIHRERLAKLAKVPGFSGSLQPGTAVDKQRTRGGVAPPAAESSAAASPTGAEGEDSDAEEDEEE